MTLEGPPPELGPWGTSEPEPNPPAGHPLAGIPLRFIQPAPGDLSGTYLAPKVNLADVTEEALQTELARRWPPDQLRGLLSTMPIEAINADLTRRFRGVALIALQVGPDGTVRDMYYTSVRGLPMPALAGCVAKLAADLQARATPIDIKPS